VRLVEFLIALLEAQAQTLQRLAALFGEEVLLEMLESAGDLPPDIITLRHDPRLFEAPRAQASGLAYQELDGAVRDLRLPAVLEFHLWAYPHYRAFIESPLDLNSRIHGTDENAWISLVEEAMVQATAWLKRLPIPPQFWIQAERAAHLPWLRFRTDVLKRIGKRPMVPVI
jgi:hypothetical protein